ncbi:MAG: radical SAM protein [Candidatus Coatesbacteria bacterium]|nr:radical SAM protein [Candidatus Coatesbacteria bacterium]
MAAGFSRRFATLVQVLRASKLSWLMALAAHEAARRMAGWPRCLLVETSTKCNLSCPWCDAVVGLSRRKRQFMPAEDFRCIMRHVGGRVTAVTFARSGEPLSNPDILEMIAEARKRSVIVTLDSNLATVSQEMTDALIELAPHRIVTTLISAERGEYEAKQVGANFERTISNIAAISSAKRRRRRHFPLVEVQLIATKTSVKQIDEFRRIVERIGCDSAYVKPMRVDTTREDATYRSIHLDDLPIGHEVCSYEVAEAGRPVLKDQAACPQLENVYVTADGDVFPCLFSPGSIEPYGNVISETFEAVWSESGLSRDKRRLLRRRASPMCANCIPSREIGSRVFGL